MMLIMVNVSYKTSFDASYLDLSICLAFIFREVQEGESAEVGLVKEHQWMLDQREFFLFLF